MCGLPFSRRTPQAAAIVATVPSTSQYNDKSIYMSYIAVRADADEARIRHELSGNLCRCTILGFAGR